MSKSPATEVESTTLEFPNLESLTFVLQSGIIPAQIAASPTKALTDAKRIWIRPPDVLPSAVWENLRRLGVSLGAAAPVGELRSVSHWPQIIPLAKQLAPPNIGAQTTVLFDIQNAKQWSAFVNEMLRLGNDRIGYRVLSHDKNHRVLAKVHGPPYFALLRAIDPTTPDAPRAYLEAAANIWIEFGHTHSLIHTVRPASGQMLLLRSPNEWEAITITPFREIDSALEIAPPVENVVGADVPIESPLDVPLILVQGEPSSPELWVIREDAVSILDDFVANADHEIFERVAFAVTSDAVIVRLRPSRRAAPEIKLRNATAFQVHRKLLNVFVPVGTRIEPPLRRNTIREILGDDPNNVTWLQPKPDGNFTPTRLSDDAFGPLSSWVDFVLDRDRAALDEWVRGSEFEYAGVVQPNVDPIIIAISTQTVKTKNGAAKTPAPVSPSRPRDLPRAEELPGPTSTVSETREKLKRAEEQFLAIDGPLDHPDRAVLWPTLARLHAELGQPAEAALNWAHAIWEAPSKPCIDAWLAAEKITELSDASMRRLLNAGNSPADVRALAVAVIGLTHRNSEPQTEMWREIHAYLLANDHQLPVRVAWLAWSSWCKQANDELALARARDRMLSRLLDRGLNAETDLPTFLRFAGRADAERLRQIRDWVDEIRRRIQQWVLDDLKERHATTGYVDLIFAFGMARLGNAHAARDLVQQATTTLAAFADDTTEAHTFLVAALTWRIEQVIAGRTHGGPLPAEQLEYLAQVRAEADKLHRDLLTRRSAPYAVERLREQSHILEPQEKFHPYRHTLVESEALIRSAQELPDLQDVGQLPGRINDLIRRAGSAGLLVHVLAVCVPLAGRLSADVAGRLLDRVVPALDAAPVTNDTNTLNTRLHLIERTLFFAAHFDRPDVVRASIERLVAIFKSASPPALLENPGEALSEMLRSLRKLGWREQAIELLDRLGDIMVRGLSPEELRQRDIRRWPAALRALLPLAAGWLLFDRTDRAMPWLDAARKLLRQAGRTPADAVSATEYSALLCNYVAALGFGPPAMARERISEMFAEGRLDRLPNTYNTARFYSRLHLNVAEAVVLTLASDDFALGPVAKRWLDDDEYLIRRRIHREVREHFAGGK